MKEQLSQLVQDVLDGFESPAKAWSVLIGIESHVKKCKEEIYDGVLDECEEFNKSEVYYGGIWELRNTPVYLDYSKDAEFTKLNKAALDRKKLLNQTWKSHNEGKGFYDKESGEEAPVLPVKTPSKRIFVFKPKKDE